jgi:hypothetical protein
MRAHRCSLAVLVLSCKRGSVHFRRLEYGRRVGREWGFGVARCGSVRGSGSGSAVVTAPARWASTGPRSQEMWLDRLQRRTAEIDQLLPPRIMLEDQLLLTDVGMP